MDMIITAFDIVCVSETKIPERETIQLKFLWLHISILSFKITARSFRQAIVKLRIAVVYLVTKLSLANNSVLVQLSVVSCVAFPVIFVESRRDVLHTEYGIARTWIFLRSIRVRTTVFRMRSVIIHIFLIWSVKERWVKSNTISKSDHKSSPLPAFSSTYAEWFVKLHFAEALAVCFFYPPCAIVTFTFFERSDVRISIAVWARCRCRSTVTARMSIGIAVRARCRSIVTARMRNGIAVRARCRCNVTRSSDGWFSEYTLLITEVSKICQEKNISLFQMSDDDAQQ